MDKLTIGLEVIGLVALIFYTTFAALQWCEMKKAANAAQGANTIAHDALVKGNRPWLGVDGSAKILKPITIDNGGIHTSVGFVVKNFGTAPALHIGIHLITMNNSTKTLANGSVDFSDFKRDADVSCRMADSSTQAIVPGEEGSGPSLFPSNFFVQRFDDMTTSPAPQPTSALDLVGCIAYSDQYKSNHHTRFCFMGEKSISNTKAGEAMLV